jgi:hypothetical protein
MATTKVLPHRLVCVLVAVSLPLGQYVRRLYVR